MPRNRWDRREQLLLEAIADAEDRVGELPDTQSLAATTGLSRADVGRAIRRLLRSEYITAKSTATHTNPNDFARIQLEERGLRAVGEWPAEDSFDALVTILEQRIEGASSPEERSKYQSLRDEVTSVGRNVLSGVLSELIKQATGLR